MRDGDDHVLALDQVLVVHVRPALGELGAARRAELVAQQDQFVLDDLLDPRARAENVEIVGDLDADLVQLVGDLVAAERRQTLQPQLEDGARLLFGEVVRAVLVDAVAWIVDQPDQRLDVGRRPAALHQLLARRLRVRRVADQVDHLVDIGDRDRQADQHMRPVARLAQQELRAPRDDVLAEHDEGAQHVRQRHLLRLAAVQRHHVGSERGLQRREPVELVQHHVGHGVALQLDHHAVALAVALVADVGDALDPLVADELGHLLDHRGLVDLIRDLGDHQRLAVAADRLRRHPAAHHDRAAPRRIGAMDAGPAEHDAAGREIGTRYDLHELCQLDRRILDQRDAAVDHLAQIVRRNVRRHADSDAAGAVDEQVRKPRRQHLRLLAGGVVGVLELDGFLVDVLEQLVRDLGEPRFGVAHRRRRIAVDRAEIALPVDQRHAQRPVLCHAHQRVVDRGVAVGVVFTHHVGDGPRRLHIFAVPVVAALVAGIEDAAVDRLQPVAHVGQRPADDHAHRIIEIGALHLLDDRDRLDAFRLARAARCCLVSQIGSRR